MASKSFFNFIQSHSPVTSRKVCGLAGLLFVLIFVAGCSTSLKSNWRNFNAYYNTFYNAKRSYNAGLQKNLAQPREYNPLQPIKVHQEPLTAGVQDFDKAIEKGADILRKHDESKWVDDALFLIGKSFYYKKEFFSAEQKFEELLITTSRKDLQQKAVLWRGRVLLSMERFNEGVGYLSDYILEFEEEWSKENLAETRAILAQYYVSLENWEMARNELQAALPHLPHKGMRERGYFLLGQINERIGDDEAAFSAYRHVHNHFSEYRLQYLAKRKQAEVARNLGRHDVASQLFNEMVRDDKNIEYKAELDFELARTEQRRGNYKTAETIYNQLLRNPFARPSNEIAARVYYGLAEIYQYDYDDFAMAAVYYDSAAQKNVPAERLPPGFAARELAESFGNYSRLKNEIALRDSLLWLGSLNPTEFDSVLSNIRAQKMAEMEQQRAEMERQQNTLVNIDTQPEEDATTSLKNGFLNSNNLALQQNAKMQFRAIWGDRPLADNWRVRSRIRTSAADTDNLATQNQNGTDNGGITPLYVEIDISNIPFTPQQQDSMRKTIAGFQYQLGNLFFLSLDMPDSAVYYFIKAVENPSSQNVTIVSLYSLSELYALSGDSLNARAYAEQLIQNFPDTEYARTLASKFDIELTPDNSSFVDEHLVFESIMGNDSLGVMAKAEQLKEFSYSFSSHKLAPQALFEAIQLYVEAGKDETEYKRKFQSWFDLNKTWRLDTEQFKALQDSAALMAGDTSLTEEQQKYHAAFADSVLQPPNFYSAFPYKGAFWDSSRAAIERYLAGFPQGKHAAAVRKLQAELQMPERETPEQEEPHIPAEPPITDANYKACAEPLIIRGGMQAFMAGIELEGDISGISEIVYLFSVNQRGIIEEYQLVSTDVPQALSRAFEERFTVLSFEPVLESGSAIPVRCSVSFPVE